MEKKYTFSVNDIQDVTTDDSAEFAIARIAVLSTKRNSHKVNITRNILMRDGSSVLGKWVIADFDGTDVTTHTNNTHIIGIVPTDESALSFVDNEDGTTTMWADAIISKLYATEVYKLFREHNFRNVSVEMATSNDVQIEDGSIDIDGLNIYSICVLGLSVAGSCPDANMSIIRFSADDANEYYNTKHFSLKQLAEKRNEDLKVVIHPIDKSKSAVDMGSWDGDKAKDDLLKEKNFKTLAKSVCLLLEDGWEDRVKSALKYPVMNLKNGKWVYNAQGLSSARAYGEQHDPSIADKAISIQKKLGLYKDDDSNKEEKMENKELNFSDSENKENEDIIMDDKKMSEDDKAVDEKEKDMACGDKEMAESEDEKLKDEEKEENEIKDEEKKMSEESEDEKLKEEKDEEDDIKDEEKKFSLDAYVDASAMLAMLENETKEYIELADKVTKEFSANEILENYIKMAKENAELKAEKEKIDNEKRDKKFASIMASVKEDLDEKTYAELSEEGKVLSFNELGAFENKVKAFAYEATKKNKEEKETDEAEIMRFGAVNENAQVDDDVFVRISKK